MAAVEGPTGVWRMVDPSGSEYGTAEMRRVMNGTDIRYRVARHGEVIGWSTTLREACWRLHQAYLSAHNSSGAPAADWGGDGWRRLSHAAEREERREPRRYNN